jgi:predicted transcriptional regulator
MLAIKERAINYINEMPDERLASALDYLRFLCEREPTFEITTKDKFYAKINEGMDDMRQGNVQPLAMAMADIRRELSQHGV